MAGQTEPLIEAVKAGNATVAGQLVNSVNASLKDVDGRPLICLAVEQGNMDTVKAILVRGASPEEVDEGGRNCIHVAAAEGRAAAISLVHEVEGGLELEATTKAGNTALHRAAAYGQRACVDSLLALGANTEAVNADGLTPLIRACRWGHADCVRALLEAGASFRAKDHSQRSGLAWARTKGFSDVEEVLLNPPQPVMEDSDDTDDEAGDEGNFFTSSSTPAAGGAGGESYSIASAAAAQSGARRASIVGTPATKFGEPMRVEGWMRKHGGTFRPWRNRFFVLEGRTVWYYAKEGMSKSKAKGVVRMVKGTEVVVEDSYTKPHCFNINTPSRKYIVQASNDEEMAEWMEALQNNLDVCAPEMALEEWDDVHG